jgi:hypothetical protein
MTTQPINNGTSRNNHSLGQWTRWTFWLGKERVGDNIGRVTTNYQAGFFAAFEAVKLKYPDAECWDYAGRLSFL